MGGANDEEDEKNTNMTMNNKGEKKKVKIITMENMIMMRRMIRT